MWSPLELSATPWHFSNLLQWFECLPTGSCFECCPHLVALFWKAIGLLGDLLCYTLPREQGTYKLTTDQSDDFTKVQHGEQISFYGCYLTEQGLKCNYIPEKPTPTQMRTYESCNPRALWRACSQLGMSQNTLSCSSTCQSFYPQQLFAASITLGRGLRDP